MFYGTKIMILQFGNKKVIVKYLSFFIKISFCNNFLDLFLNNGYLFYI